MIMVTMKTVQTASVGAVEVVEADRPEPGPRDALVRIRACGICGTDVTFVHMGGMPTVLGAGAQALSADQMRPVVLGHEPAGEIVAVGAQVEGLRVGDHVVINPQGAPSGIIGCGGPLGGMSEYLLIEDAVVGKSVAVLPDSVPFDVAALNEPMAVSRHAVNRSQAVAGEKAIVFGAGPIGLGATIWLKLLGVHVVVADVIESRLETALAVGADAVIDSGTEDVAARLTELHGTGRNALGAPRPDTDIYIDAAGVAVVVNTALRSGKWNARLVTVAMHKQPEPIDLGAILRSEMTIIGSQGYPTEIFEVTSEIAEHAALFARLISHRVPFAEVGKAFELALTPGAAEKVVVTYE